MLKKRIIPCLDIKDGRVVKGINFTRLRDAGDPVALARQYAEQGADELVLLDITATLENRKTLAGVVCAVAREINIPFTVGGGIDSAEDARLLIRYGADKISLNSAAVHNPALISDVAKILGSQAVVVAIDTMPVDGEWQVFVNAGKVATGMSLVTWAKDVERLGAGEILLTSMRDDGTQTGFAIDAITNVCATVNIPVIASGGAGIKEHFNQLFSQTEATGALAASIFHYASLGLPELKVYLKNQNLSIR
jgi:imidazole glycerol-phosphate synthase subunit HisF